MEPDLRRRRLCSLLAAALPGFALPAFSQRTLKRVGILTGPSTDPAFKALFARALGEYGFREGENVEIVWNFTPLGEAERELPVRAARMAKEFDCLMTFGSVYTRYLRDATTSVPIVTTIGDPVSAGFAVSLARPGGNVTGLHQGFAEVALKQVEMLRAIVPGLSCMAWVAFRGQMVWLPTYETAARAARVSLRPVVPEHPDRLEAFKAEFSRLRSDGCTAAYVYSQVPTVVQAVTSIALQHRIAIATVEDNVTHDGFLFAYSSVELEERGKRMAYAVARVLRGESPASMPFEGPARYRLTLNMSTARRIGVTVPRDIVVLADKVLG